MTNFSMADLGTVPIDGAVPAGSEVREEPAYESLESEVAKLASPVHSASIQWNVVTELSAGLLANKGKDLMVACYLAAALLETRGLVGLGDGVKVVADMLQIYWDTLYPSLKRIRGRRNAIQWLVDRVQRRASEAGWAELPAQPPELLAQLLDNLQAIDRLLTEKDNEGPSVRSLVGLIKALPAIELVAPSVAAVGTPAGRLPIGDMRQPLTLKSAEQAGQALDDACAQLEPIAAWLMNNDASDALAFRLDRLAAWTSINSLPAAGPGRETGIVGPISQITDVLQRLKVSQSNEETVQFAEAQLAVFPFWLDLNCVCAEALGQMGSSYAAAQLEVCGETARLIARLPGLEQLSFAGGMPFADNDTLFWLQSLASSLDDMGHASAPPARDEQAAVAAQARALAVNGELAAAVDLLQAQIAAGISPRDKLFMRIRLCELLLQQRPGAALDGFAFDIVDCIERHQLADWDPSLALDGLVVAYRVGTRNEDAKTLADSLLRRIVGLNAATAAKLITSPD